MLHRWVLFVGGVTVFLLSECWARSGIDTCDMDSAGMCQADEAGTNDLFGDAYEFLYHDHL